MAIEVYYQAVDPGAVGTGKLWVDTSVGPPYQLKARNVANNGWDNVGVIAGGAPTDATYAVRAANAGLSAELVVPDFLGHPDIPPASPNAKDDEFTAAVLDAKWSWVNQDAATIDLATSPGVLLMNIPAGAGDDLRILEQPIPAGAFTMVCKCAIARFGVNYSAVGLGMRDSVTGRIATWFLDYNSSGPSYFPVCGTGVSAEKFTDPHTGSAPYFAATEQPLNGIYLRWRDDLANHYLSFSPDGRCWHQLYAGVRTAWLANPNRICIIAGVNNASYVAQAAWEWFRVTEP